MMRNGGPAGGGLFVLFTCFVVTIFLQMSSVDAIKCYQCSSLTEPDCFMERIDSTAIIDNTTVVHASYDYLLKECTGEYFGHEPFCRKTDFTVLWNKTRRVVRTCGYRQSHRNCYVADNEDHLEQVCQCFTDACNRAAHIQHGHVSTTIVAAAFVATLIGTLKQ